MQSQNLSPQSPKEVLDEATLVDQLNAFLASLHLPISLISPTDLTPSLLIAILESLLGERIPMIERENDVACPSRASKVQNMKIFLGVLENDVLQRDFGLSDLDPRRLADGDDEEVLYIAELLCWIGSKMSSTRKSSRQDYSPPRSPELLGQSTAHVILQPLSPKSQLDFEAESLFQTGSTMTGSQTYPALFSPFFQDDEDTMTSLFSDLHHEHSEEENTYSDTVSDILSGLPSHTSPRTTPHCIHEVPSPSLLFDVDPNATPRPQPAQTRKRTSAQDHFSKGFCDCDASIDESLPIEHDHPSDQSRTSVRYSGFIEPVDEDFEIASFEASRSMSFASTSSSGKNKPSVKIESVKKLYTRTLELLNERTRLLTQLSELKSGSHG